MVCTAVNGVSNQCSRERCTLCAIKVQKLKIFEKQICTQISRAQFGNGSESDLNPQKLKLKYITNSIAKGLRVSD